MVRETEEDLVGANIHETQSLLERIIAASSIAIRLFLVK